MYVKLFSSILDSSVWDEDLPTKVLWITMLAMADEEGVVGASVGGLARRAGITREDCERGLARFMEPDPDSRSEEFEGRRIEKVDGGWRLLNHARYREIRTRKQEREAQRQQRHRDRLRAGGDVTVTGVTPRDESVTRHARHAPLPPTASASASVSEREPEDQEQENSTGRESEGDPLDAVLDETGFDLGAFAEEDAKLIRGFLRGQRSPFAVTQVLRAHLLGEERVEPAVLAQAVREYAALAEPAFRSRHFAGFVKRARAHAAQKPSRVQSLNEERFITAEDVERERERREEIETEEMLRAFERTNAEEYERLTAEAERLTPANFKGQWRAPVVRAKLAHLIREATNATR